MSYTSCAPCVPKFNHCPPVFKNTCGPICAPYNPCAPICPPIIGPTGPTGPAGPAIAVQRVLQPVVIAVAATQTFSIAVEPGRTILSIYADTLAAALATEIDVALTGQNTAEVQVTNTGTTPLAFNLVVTYL